MYWIAAIALPFVASLQRYAVAYGYEGVGRAEAFKSARCVFGIAATISGLLVLAKFY